MYPFSERIPETCRLLYKQIDTVSKGGCHLDVWVPPDRNLLPSPVAIHIHGGAFVQGCSKDVAFNQIEWFLEQGIVCVSVEYRLAPQAVFAEIRQDLLDAYVYVHDHLETALRESLGGDAPRIDGSRIIIGGGSAGGTSTIVMASDVVSGISAGRLKIHPPRAILPAFPLIDWSHPKMNNRPRAELKEMWGDKPDWPLLEAFVKGEPCTGEPYPEDVFKPDLTNPRILFGVAMFESRTANSFVLGQDLPYSKDNDILSGLTPSFPPTTIFCAMRDSLIPVEHSFMFRDRLRELGVEVRTEEVDAEHGFSDLPPRYFPDDVPRWWSQHILPSLIWAVDKLERSPPA